MSNKNNFLEDFAKLGGNLASIASEGGKDFQDKIKSLISNALRELDVVSREEFEVVKEMAEKARMENIALKAQLDNLSPASTKKKTASKSTTTKTTTKKAIK